MPELPEVEIIVRGLDRALAGARIVRVEVLDPAVVQGDARGFGALVAGRRVVRARRRAKLALLDLDPALTLAFHLKMTGRLVVQNPGQEARDRARLIFHLDNRASLVFADLRRFGWCRAVSPDGFKDWDFFRSLGPEPLEIGPAEFADRFRGRRASIKALLLDQRVVAGVGNIYADEALFRAGIRPTARASDISLNRLRGLHAALSAVLGQAISENGSSIRDYVDSGGAAGAFQNSFRAYGRAGLACPRCGENMVRVRVAGRATTYCPGCQK